MLDDPWFSLTDDELEDKLDLISQKKGKGTSKQAEQIHLSLNNVKEGEDSLSN